MDNFWSNSPDMLRIQEKRLVNGLRYDIPELPIQDLNLCPHARFRGVVRGQSGWNGLSLKNDRSFVRFEVVGQFEFVTPNAVEGQTEFGRSTVFGDDPGPVFKRRVMAHMLPMTTREVGDPIVSRVTMKSYNFSLHR